MTNRDISELKRSQLSALAAYRNSLFQSPDLRWIFFELTNACNLFCAHCGSRCCSSGDRLSVQDIEKTLCSVPKKNAMVCLTGGEPLIHPDFFHIARTVKELGFHWGMTTNGTLIDRHVAQQLKKAMMETVSISLDGLELTHDTLRGSSGAWAKAVEGIRNLQEAGYAPQVTTVVHSSNFCELEELYSFLTDLRIKSWRIINVEPIGRACEMSDLLLSGEQFRELLAFIQSKRYDPACSMEVTYGCSHFLGLNMERMVRNNYFFCGAGIYVASVRSNGDICTCLDIENLPSLIQGNIHKDDFWDVWSHRFRIFRTDRTDKSQLCRYCEDRVICGGDSAHSWDWNSNEPLLCVKQLLKDNREEK
ncbi:MAG: radical SAM protein [Clostridia bacterium]|nr:radical SAM protein [Clostridia bacterium]